MARRLSLGPAVFAGNRLLNLAILSCNREMNRNRVTAANLAGEGMLEKVLNNMKEVAERFEIMAGVVESARQRLLFAAGRERSNRTVIRGERKGASADQYCRRSTLRDKLERAANAPDALFTQRPRCAERLENISGNAPKSMYV